MHALPIANTLERRKAFQSFLGVSPALIAIGLFLMVPILIVIGYSLMEANPYGGVNKVFSSDAYTSLLFERQMDDSLAFADSYLIIALRSIGIAGLTTHHHPADRFSGRRVAGDATGASSWLADLSDHRAVLGQPADPHLRVDSAAA